MRTIERYFVAVAAGLFFTGSVVAAEKRVWTAKSGHQVIATLEDQTPDAVSLRIANRPQAVVVMMSDLTAEDQAFARRAAQKPPKLMINKPGAHLRRMDNPLFADYVNRLQTRRYMALEARRAYNLSKGPAVYYMGSMPNPMFPMGIAIQQGWVQQPPIPVPFYGRVRVNVGGGFRGDPSLSPRSLSDAYE